MNVKCYNKKCLHEWFYRGENKKFICCPKCRFKRLLLKCKEFYQKEHTLKEVIKDIPIDRPNDIPKEGAYYSRVIKKPQTNFIEKPKEIPKEGNLGEVREIKKEETITIIPRDPTKLLDHQKSYN